MLKKFVKDCWFVLVPIALAAAFIAVTRLSHF